MLFPIPFLMKVQYFVIGLICIEIFLTLLVSPAAGESTAYMAHLGGLVFGYIWLKFVPRRGLRVPRLGESFTGYEIPTIAGSAGVRPASSKCTCASTTAPIIATKTTSMRMAGCVIPKSATGTRKMETRGRPGSTDGDAPYFSSSKYPMSAGMAEAGN